MNICIDVKKYTYIHINQLFSRGADSSSYTEQKTAES